MIDLHPNQRSEQKEESSTTQIELRHHLNRSQKVQSSSCLPQFQPISSRISTDTVHFQRISSWPSRDPIGEFGGLNVYGFVGNNGINFFDVLGLDQWDELVFSEFVSTISTCHKKGHCEVAVRLAEAAAALYNTTPNAFLMGLGALDDSAAKLREAYENVLDELKYAVLDLRDLKDIAEEFGIDKSILEKAGELDAILGDFKFIVSDSIDKIDTFERYIGDVNAFTSHKHAAFNAIGGFANVLKRSKSPLISKYAELIEEAMNSVDGAALLLAKNNLASRLPGIREDCLNLKPTNDGSLGYDFDQQLKSIDNLTGKRNWLQRLRD